MATCPRCLGALTEDHRCPKGRFSEVWPWLITATVGSVAGGILCYALQERPSEILALSYAALGAVLAIVVRQALGSTR